MGQNQLCLSSVASGAAARECMLDVSFNISRKELLVREWI